MTIIAGTLGGVLGSAFTHLNLVFARRRKAFIDNVKVSLFSNNGAGADNFSVSEPWS